MTSLWNSFRPSRLALLGLVLSFSLLLSAWPVAAQGVSAPRREQLLNGLNILLWEQPGRPDVLLKLRIHSGAAFDLAGKAGTMALLGDALFPDPTTREYITGELGGKVEVTTDYDAINITLAARAQDYERLVELLRTAIINLSLTADRVAELRAARLKMVREAGASPVAIADRAIAARLFGDYPYGRPYAGTTDNLSRIDRSDLQFARERFLNPNNATLVIVGGVERTRALRALRQLLGAWVKSEKIAPSTFRQPEAPDARPLIVDLPGTEMAEVRVAARGIARSDRDYGAGTLLALVARERWQTAMPELKQTGFFVRNETHVLPGSFIMGASLPAKDAARAISTAQKVLQDLAKTPPTASELERARTEALAAFNRQMEKPETIADLWLDAETYKLPSVAERARALTDATPADVQRVAGRLLPQATVNSMSKMATDATMATVVVGNAQLLKSELERTGKVEILSNAEALPAPPVPAPGNTTKKAP